MKRCPKCRTPKVWKVGKRPSVSEGLKQRFRCSKCGTSFY